MGRPTDEVPERRSAAGGRTRPAARARAHLNNAGAALTPRPVHQAVAAHLRPRGRARRLRGVRDARSRRQVADVYRDVGRLLGAESRNIAFTQNSTARLCPGARAPSTSARAT